MRATLLLALPALLLAPTLCRADADSDAAAALALALALRPAVPPESPPPPVTGLRWEDYDPAKFKPGDAPQIKLVDRDGEQVGTWVFSERRYYRRLGPGRWVEELPPIPPPTAPKSGACTCGDRCPAGRVRWNRDFTKATCVCGCGMTKPASAAPVQTLMRYQEGAVYSSCGPRG